jgi:hypothetical protein
MTPLRWLQIALVLTVVCCPVPVLADAVQLANGDVLNGRVLGLDDKNLRLESDTLGQINIPRAKIVTITLGDRKPIAAAEVARPGPAASQTPEDVLKQFKVTGLNPKDLGDVQKMLPLLATPEASKYFDETVKGLMGGTKSLGDLRKEAIHARDELKKATKGLGPDVDGAVAPYLMILEKFIRETQPPTPPAQPDKPKPPEKKEQNGKP